MVLDNFSPHKHPNVRAWAAANDIEMVVLPTYGSWLNWIESECAALRYFALTGTDHRSHGEQNAAIGAYVRWRDARARQDRGSAAGWLLPPGGRGRLPLPSQGRRRPDPGGAYVVRRHVSLSRDGVPCARSKAPPVRRSRWRPARGRRAPAHTAA